MTRDELWKVLGLFAFALLCLRVLWHVWGLDGMHNHALPDWVWQ